MITLTKKSFNELLEAATASGRPFTVKVVTSQKQGTATPPISPTREALMDVVIPSLDLTVGSIVQTYGKKPSTIPENIERALAEFGLRILNRSYGATTALCIARKNHHLQELLGLRYDKNLIREDGAEVTKQVISKAEPSKNAIFIKI